MGQILTSIDELPSRKYYVLAYDTFLSDWENGPTAGRWDVCVVATDEYVVAANAYKKFCSRPEMTKVMLLDSKIPQIDLTTCLLDYMSPEKASYWYEIEDESLAQLTPEKIHSRYWVGNGFEHPDKDGLRSKDVPVKSTPSDTHVIGSSRVDPKVAEILENCRIEGNTLFLPPEQLPSKLYQAVNKVLVAMGGKWNKKAGGHVFKSNPEDALEAVLLTGEVVSEKVKYQFFPTPGEIAKRLVELAQIEPGDTVLEPSAGDGAIVKAIREHCSDDITLMCMEMDPQHEQALIEAGADTVTITNFLDCVVSGVKKIVANPPFTRQQDIDHVNHMLDLLEVGGRLVSVMSGGTLFNTNKKAKAFRERIASMGGEFIELPAGAFSESGTQVSTCIVVVDKKCNTNKEASLTSLQPLLPGLADIA